MRRTQAGSIANDHVVAAYTYWKILIPIIAFGGVASIADLAVLATYFNQGIVGVVVARALYERRLSLVGAMSASG